MAVIGWQGLLVGTSEVEKEKRTGRPGVATDRAYWEKTKGLLFQLSHPRQPEREKGKHLCPQGQLGGISTAGQTLAHQSFLKALVSTGLSWEFIDKLVIHKSTDSGEHWLSVFTE